MKQADVIIGQEYLLKINGTLCRVKVTGKRKIDGRGNLFDSRARTAFDWVRVDPPPNAIKRSGADTAARFRTMREIGEKLLQGFGVEPDPYANEAAPPRSTAPTTDGTQAQDLDWGPVPENSLRFLEPEEAAPLLGKDHDERA